MSEPLIDYDSDDTRAYARSLKRSTLASTRGERGKPMTQQSETQEMLKQIRERHAQQPPSSMTMREWSDIDFLLSLIDTRAPVDSQEAGDGDERRARALTAREDWQRWDWDGAKPYKEHLRERLRTADDYLGYLDACYEEGPETFALATHDVLEFAAAQMRDACVETIRALRPAATGAGAFKDAAITALSSLTLDQVKQDTMKS